MIAYIRQRPWLWIVLGFLILFSAWTVFMTIAIKNQPESVPLEHIETET